MTIRPAYGPARDKRTTAYALIAAFMIVVMLTAQLFGYEEFAAALSMILPAGDARLLSLAAASLVFTELFALPYLLNMYVSLGMRVLSALFGAGVAGFWLFASFTNAHAGNSGLFSTTLEVPGGLVAATWSIVLFGLVCKVIFADSRFRHATS